ncbi:MAG: hypothetical protein VKO01_10775 [Cyanobacteriota bacterium]|nr:hypothetical protein [Cyanobacteriota bacterium]
MSMTLATHFIELDLPLLPPNLVERVEAALQNRGTPLRWAITAVDREQLTLHVEAVVTGVSSPPAGNDQT